MYNDNLSLIYDANNLIEAFNKSKQGVAWKESVQGYEIHLLRNVRDTQFTLMNDSYKSKPMVEFDLKERGHTRHIKAQHIFDRVIQRSLNDNMLLPRIRPKLIYDNGASLKDKGLDFARKRFEIHLKKAYNKYGENGVILFSDFTKFFDNILHDKVLAMFKPYLSNKEYKFVAERFNDFAIDISYLSDKEAAVFMKKVFNNLDYCHIPENLKTGKRFARKSVGIGNQISQVAGVLYPHRIDNYCKIVRGLKYYGRYMDDTYIILDNKEELKEIFREIKAICSEYGIFVNEKKTHIYKLSHWLTWLKINYKVIKRGRRVKIIKKVHNETIRRERRRLKRFQRLYKNGRMSLEDIKQCYKSWRGTYQKYDSGVKLHRLNKYFYQLFKEVV